MRRQASKPPSSSHPPSSRPCEALSVEAPPVEASAFEPSLFEAAPFEAHSSEAFPFEAPPFTESSAPEHAPEPEGAFGPAANAFSESNFAEDAFANNFDMPQDLADALAQPAPVSDNFLSAARRSAKAAAEAEAERGNRGFSWSVPTTGGDEKSSPRYLVMLVIGFVVLLAIAAGLMLSQRNPAPQLRPKAVAPHAAAPIAQRPKASAAIPNPASSGRFVPAPQVAPVPLQNNAAKPLSAPVKPAPGKPAAATPIPTTLAPLPATPKTAQPLVAAPAGSPSKEVPPQVAKSAPSPSADKVAAAANAGNATAETIIGLKYLDGQGIVADPAQALKWLEKAADARPGRGAISPGHDV